MHLGMTGWIEIEGADTRYYKRGRVIEGDGEVEEWPPKYAKFTLECAAEDGKERVRAAFVDARRLARVRLVDCPAEEIRQTSPLKENGPDPIRDKEVVTVEWLGVALRKKRVPVKALLLDQAVLSGVGNWVADEVLYQARLHPEQYSHTFSDEQVGILHEKLMEVCGIAVGTLADSSQFPETWLMKHRWGKGKKDANTLPNGEVITFLTVGGRTSAIVAARQKKTGGDVEVVKRKRKAKVEDEDGADVKVKEPEVVIDGEPEVVGTDVVVEKAARPSRARKGKAEVVYDEASEEEKKPAKKAKKATRPKKEQSEDEEDASEGAALPAKKRAKAGKPKREVKASPKADAKPAIPGERRSARAKA